jgi:hypothetical protein
MITIDQQIKDFHRKKVKSENIERVDEDQDFDGIYLNVGEFDFDPFVKFG